jgi:hypothetical protein
MYRLINVKLIPMCKEIPAIPVNRVVDKNRIIGKMEGQVGGEAQGVTGHPKN